MRSYLREAFQDLLGNAVKNTALSAFKTDGTTPFDRTIYTTATGSTVATVATNGNGEFEGFVEGPTPVLFTVPGRSSQLRTSFDRDFSRGCLWATDMGAVGDGTTDDTAALQRWLDRLAVLGVSGYLPKGTYKCTAGLTGSQQPHLYGDGMSHSTIQLANTVSSTTDCLTITTDGITSRGLTIRDMAITVQAGGGGRHALVLDTQAQDSFFADFSIERCSLLGGPNGRALTNTPDATPSSPSFPQLFDSRVVGCLIGGGTKLTSAADSIWWQHNLSYGANAGLEIDTVPGAGKWVIRDSTFVNAGGGIWGKSTFTNLSILDNYLEQPSAITGGSGGSALIHLTATNSGEILGTKISGNQFSPGLVGFGVVYSVLLHNCTGTVFGPNDYGLQHSSQFGVRADSTCIGTVVLHGNANTGGVGTLVSANGETDLLDLSKDRGGEVVLSAAGGGSDTFSLGATVAGHITIWESSNLNLATGLVHGPANAVTSIAATNFSGAGTGILIQTTDPATTTGIVLCFEGGVYKLKNRAALQRTVRFRITGFST